MYKIEVNTPAKKAETITSRAMSRASSSTKPNTSKSLAKTD
mgnify:CR=1 FL=1